jgi:hypothetical protein
MSAASGRDEDRRKVSEPENFAILHPPIKFASSDYGDGNCYVCRATRYPESGFVSCLRVASGNLAKETVNAMNSSACGKKHEWTLAGDDADPVLTAESDGSGADRACAHATVHPDEANAGSSAVDDNGFGYLRGSHQQGGFDRRVDILHAGETWVAKNVRGMGIYGDNVIAAMEEFLE